MTGWHVVVIVIAFLAIVGCTVWLMSRTPKSKYDPNAVVLRKDIFSCDGCGCLLQKNPQFRQPSTIERCLVHTYVGFLFGMKSDYEDRIIEHYLCLRCQVDGTPPAKVAEAIDEARAAAGEKPC